MSRCGRGQCHNNDNGDVCIDNNIDEYTYENDDHRGKRIIAVGDCDTARRWHSEKSVHCITIVVIAVFVVVS